MGKPDATRGRNTVCNEASFVSLRDRFYEGAVAGARALIVDDNYRNVIALDALLKRGSVKVQATSSGRVAIDLLERRGDIDIVLMDVQMPLMDGYETMSAIRRGSRFAKLPIIAITGSASIDERERCLAAGATDFLNKPIDTEALLMAICHWLPASIHLPRFSA
jgi:CheY-like chemotaxis protein